MSKQLKFKFKKTLKKAEFVHADLEYHQELSQEALKDITKYVPEGVEGMVKFKGSVKEIIYNLVGGLKSSMGYMGAKTIKDLQKKGQFLKISKAGFYESMVHNVDHVIKNE